MKKNYLTLITLFLANVCFAQKLPNIQESQIAVPSTVKIDGKLNEWGNEFGAENKRTSLYYTLSNDNNNLYLVIKSSNAGIIGKILAGGITMNVNVNGKKEEKEAISITYPKVKRGAGARGGGRGEMMAMFGGVRGGGNNVLTQAQRDSIALINYKTQLATAKEIQVIGIPSIKDTLISIYNEYGIKSAASFDEKGMYTSELSIPLSLFPQIKSSKGEIAYQIKLNGFSMPNMGGREGGFGGGGGGNGFGGGVVVVSGGGGGGGNRGGGMGNNNMMDMMTPTDFWGKYTIQK